MPQQKKTQEKYYYISSKWDQMLIQKQHVSFLFHCSLVTNTLSFQVQGRVTALILSRKLHRYLGSIMDIQLPG